MNISPPERDKLARALYVLAAAGDSLDLQTTYEEIWDSGWVPSAVAEPYRVRAEDLIDMMDWRLTRG